MAAKGFLKKAGRYVRREAKRRYTTKKGGMRVGKIMKDVAYLKSVLNPEKKNVVLSNSTQQYVGCFNGNASGYFALDITPTPSQGSTETTRNGNSIRWCSSYLQLQLSHMSASNLPIKFKVLLVRFKGIPYSSAATYPTVMLNPNPFLTGFNVYDFNSTFEQSFLPNLSVVWNKNYTLQANQISGVPQIKNVKIPLKHKNHHVKYSSDASTTPVHGQMYMFVFADAGNASGSTAVTGQTNAIVTAINTGMKMNYNIINYYYDN